VKCSVCGAPNAIYETRMCGPCTFGEADTLGQVFTATPVEPESDAFVVGYSTCEALLDGIADDPDPGAITLVNPFKEGTDQHRGFEQAFYDLTQK
jgi:hypothetical protein